MSRSVVNPLQSTLLDEVPRDDLIEELEARGEGGIRIDFAGKGNARTLARRVRPRVARTLTEYSLGSDQEQTRNLIIEGDNLQAMATLYRDRGHVDLVLTDPPYNTGNDWRYNDRWEEDPNDPGIGDWVSEDDGARHQMDALHVAAPPDDEVNAQAHGRVGHLHRPPRAVPPWGNAG